MNDIAIKNFAVAARRQLLDDVRLQMKRWAIDEEGAVPASADTLQGEILTPQQRRQRAELLSLCRAKGEDQLAEQAAYTWFNRFLAIRFMELHDYLPCGLRFFSSADGSFDPQVLKEALQADIEGIDRARVAELVRSSDDNALFRYLFIAQCNELASCMPAVFERVGSAMELLLPESLLREGSILDHMVSDIPEDDWREGVEIVGWMYQYYVSERKDEVFASFKRGKKAEKDAIAPATQLFTPNWIVRYLVENSLGRLWMLNHPDSSLKDRMKYFIAPEAEAHEEFKCVSSPEEITVCDPACGSGHILVYAVELLAAMSEESGYMRRDIPRALLENNLSGMEIDPRAGALASFALTMKALEMDSRFLRREVQPDIKVLKPVSLTEEELELVPEIAGRKALLDAVEHMDECGSLYEPEEEDHAALKIVADRLASGISDLFADSATEKIGAMLADCEALARKFDVVVANPPYMGSSNMGKWLAAWTKKHYPDSKRDLCACFIERGFSLSTNMGYSSMVTMESWMFLSSFERLREKIISKHSISSLVYMNHMVMRIAFNTSATVFLNGHFGNMSGQFTKIEYQQLDRTGTPPAFPSNEVFCRKAQDFKSIPGSPIAYWASDAFQEAFLFFPPVGSVIKMREGIHTGDNEKYLRYWFEVPFEDIVFDAKTFDDVDKKGRWIPYSKGGSFRRWFGNIDLVIPFDAQSRDSMSQLSGHVRPSQELYFREGATWSALSSGKLSLRYLPPGHLFDSKGQVAVGTRWLEVITVLNSSVVQTMANMIMPTLDYKCGDVRKLPFADPNETSTALAKDNIALSHLDWDSTEGSFGYKANPLI